jgi:hypothetical protein
MSARALASFNRERIPERQPPRQGLGGKINPSVPMVYECSSLATGMAGIRRGRIRLVSAHRVSLFRV